MYGETPAHPSLVEIASALSDRLCTWQALPVSLCAPLESPLGLRDPGVIRMEIRPEFQGRIDRMRALFSQENSVLVQVERDAQPAFRWDEGLLADESILGEHGVSHYLVDIDRATSVLAAVLSHSPVAPEARRDALEEAVGLLF